MDIIEFTHSKTGMEDEYKKILSNEIEIFIYNGKTHNALKDRHEELRKRKIRIIEELERQMVEISLTSRALYEISANWNNKKYWNKE